MQNVMILTIMASYLRILGERTEVGRMRDTGPQGPINEMERKIEAQEGRDM